MEKLFKVTITETLVRNLGVKAKSLEEATKKVNGLYLDAKINLMDENFVEDYGLKGEEVYRFEFNKLENIEALKIMEAK
jgi:hypothetical protein